MAPRNTVSNSESQQIKSLTSSTDKKNLLIDVKLNTYNFNLWFYAIKMLLEDEDQLDANITAATGDCPVGIKDTARSRRIIFTNCSAELQPGLIQFESAPQMWNFIYKKFSGKNIARKNQGIKQLATFRFAQKTVQENILQLVNLVASTEISAGTKTISIEELGVHMLLNCLPSRFHGVRSVLESKNEELDIATLSAALVAEEERQLSREDATHDFAGAVAFTRKLCIHNRNPSRSPNTLTS
jgi:hypothetical protein